MEEIIIWVTLMILNLRMFVIAKQQNYREEQRKLLDFLGKLD